MRGSKSGTHEAVGGHRLAILPSVAVATVAAIALVAIADADADADAMAAAVGGARVLSCSFTYTEPARTAVVVVVDLASVTDSCARTCGMYACT